MVIDSGSVPEHAIVGVFRGKKFYRKRFRVAGRLAERLLPAIAAVCKKADCPAGRLSGALVVRQNKGSFTSQRIGIVVANALGLALGVPVGFLESMPDSFGDLPARIEWRKALSPHYDREPTITIPK